MSNFSIHPMGWVHRAFLARRGTGAVIALGVALGLLGTAVPFVDVSSDELSTKLEQAIELHNRAVAGDEDAIDEAVTMLTEVLEAEPEHAVALAYLGSTYSVKARESKNPLNKTRYVNRGIRYLDEAVALAPGDFEVLTVSANVNMSLPAMFGRGAKALANAEALDRIYTESPSPQRAPHMVAVYEFLHEEASAAGDAAAAAAWLQKSTEAAELAAQE